MTIKVLSLYLTKKNLVIVQDLCQLDNQILLIILQKKLIKLNVKILIVCMNMRVSMII